MDKILQSFSHPYALKLTASQTKISVLLLNHEGRNSLRKCYTRHKLYMHFIHSPTREIQIYFRSCMANSKRKFSLLCHTLSSSLKYIKV